MRREQRFDEIYRETREPVLRYFLRRVQDVEVSADCMAQTFTTVWRRIDDLPAGDAGRLWVFGIVRLVLADSRRSAARYDRLTRRLGTQLAVTIQELDHGSMGVGSALARAFDVLSSEDRELVLLSVVDGFSAPELSELFGLNVQTVRTRLHRARLALKGQLSDVRSGGS